MTTHNIKEILGTDELLYSDQALRLYNYLIMAEVCDYEQLDFQGIDKMTTLFLTQSLSRYIMDTQVTPIILCDPEHINSKKLEDAIWKGENNEMYDQILESIENTYKKNLIEELEDFAVHCLHLSWRGDKQYTLKEAWENYNN